LTGRAQQVGGDGPPRGFRDILPTEARELRTIAHALNETFASYGYMPLEPPIVERGHASPLLDGDRVIRFLDRDGELVALRPDITTAVARLVAQRYAGTTGALRLAYFGPVFREEPAMRGEEREFDQAGAELVGPTGTLADAESLALLAEALARAGLQDATIEVGHIGAVRALFTGLAADALDDVMRDLRGGDHVGALRRARDAGLNETAIARARASLAARGLDVESVGVEGADYLRAVLALAQELYPGAAQFRPNFALIPALPYYTGIVFEALHPSIGFPIAAGGRYDLLLGAFGEPRPACGFAINIQRLHLALYSSGWRPAADETLIVLEPGDPVATSRLAAKLRRECSVTIGEPAEVAGLRAVTATVVDEEHARLADGRTLDVAALREHAARWRDS
jgi:ATP phosphoribosyltransferase regulatory subunit